MYGGYGRAGGVGWNGRTAAAGKNGHGRKAYGRQPLQHNPGQHGDGLVEAANLNGVPPWGQTQVDLDRRRDQEIKDALARQVDPVAYLWHMGFEPDPWQAAFLRSDHPSKLLNCSRQVGKSTVSAGSACHRAIYMPGSLILLVAPGERQSLELMRKVYEFYAQSIDAPPLVHEGASELETVTGSRIVALPGKEGTVRGYSAVDLLIIDEASRVPDELFIAVLPMLAISRGSLYTLSTPFGSRGWWWEEVERVKGYRRALRAQREGRRIPVPMYTPFMEDRNVVEGKLKLPVLAPWDYYEVEGADCPRLTPEYLDRMKQTMGEWWYNQEYRAMFMDAQTAPFTMAQIEQAFMEEVEPWQL
jgi:hypothetical protein